MKVVQEEGGESESETLHRQTDEARHCTQLIKKETFCFNELTANESGRELICLRGTQ